MSEPKSNNLKKPKTKDSILTPPQIGKSIEDNPVLPVEPVVDEAHGAGEIPEAGIDLNTIQVHPENVIIDDKPVGKPDLTHDQLIQGLYAIWDAMERSSVDMVVIGPTCYAVTHDEDLKGNRVTVGIRRNQWNSSARGIVEAFITPDSVEMDGDLLHYILEGVPVDVYILTDHATLLSPNQTLYRNEYFYFPNPVESFIADNEELWKQL